MSRISFMVCKSFYVFIIFISTFWNHFSYGMEENWEKFNRKIDFSDISAPQISNAMPVARIVKHASKGAITGNGVSYVSSNNYVAKAKDAFVDIPSVCCMTKYSGVRSAACTIADIRILPENERGPRLHSEIAFLQDLTGVCDPARQNPAENSIFMAIIKDIQDSLSEENESFDLEIFINNSRNYPCTSLEFQGDLGMDCHSYLKLFCEKIDNCDWFQQMTSGICKIYVQTPNGIVCIE